MFNFLKKKQPILEEPDVIYEQCLIVRVLFEGPEEFGTKEDQKAIYALEDILEPKMPKGCDVDGHAFGEGTGIIYLYGPSADELFKIVEPVLKDSSFTTIKATLRYGLPEDPDAKEKEVVVK